MKYITQQVIHYLHFPCLEWNELHCLVQPITWKTKLLHTDNQDKIQQQGRVDFLAPSEGSTDTQLAWAVKVSWWKDPKEGWNWLEKGRK